MTWALISPLNTYRWPVARSSLQNSDKLAFHRILADCINSCTYFFLRLTISEAESNGHSESTTIPLA